MKFNWKENHQNAIGDDYRQGPIFGHNDIQVVSNSNRNSDSYLNIVNSFENKELNLGVEETQKL